MVPVTATILIPTAIVALSGAPWDPTQRLVVRGVYRYVRNPMISGVVLIARDQ